MQGLKIIHVIKEGDGLFKGSTSPIGNHKVERRC